MLVNIGMTLKAIWQSSIWFLQGFLTVLILKNSLTLVSTYEEIHCPKECTCSVAPLRAAPFVLTWMTSWGEDDIPDLHPNDALDQEELVKSGTASDAGVDVSIIGIHATCSLHQSVSLPKLILALPIKTMVLGILQSPGCNLTIIDGREFSRLSLLKALHLHGHVHDSEEEQISNVQSNNIAMMKHRRLRETNKRNADRITKDLKLAIVEDALQPLKNLELLDLQYVRLLASEEAHRLRRYSTEPISTAILLNMPLPQFFSLASQVEAFKVPPHLQELYDSKYISKKYLSQSSTKLQVMKHEKKLKYPFDYSIEHNSRIPLYDTMINLSNKDDVNEAKSSFIVPYSTYKADMEPKLAPFKSLKQLKYLRIARACLDKIGPEFLEGLQGLHTLTLEYNKIKLIPNELFKPTVNLRHLSLAHNQVLMLSAGSLVFLTKLLTLDLDYNQLSILGPATFPYLAHLKTLRLNENPLTHLLPDAFASLNSTESIYLGSASKPMDLHENSFRFLFSVKNVELRNVSLQTLKKSLLEGMPNVQKLAIHGEVSRIDYDTFSVTPMLKNLNISHCHLSYLSVDALYGLYNLEILDLSNNKLASISPGTLDHLYNLRELYLHNNLLSTLPLGVFLTTSTKLIQLHNNPWHCTCDLLQLRPDITNIVKRKGHTVCRWDAKMRAVCEKTEDRLIYDARVAPLCEVPLEFTGSDVYHTALRHLKCNKYHWNPMLLLKLQLRGSPKAIAKKKKKNIPIKKVLNGIEGQKDKWLPLTAYTPEPFEYDDLLDIAEREGLEEVSENSRPNERKKSKQLAKLANKNQNDDPLHLFKSSSPYIRPSLFREKSRYSSLKRIFKKNLLKRKEEKMKKHRPVFYNKKSPIYFKKQKKTFKNIETESKFYDLSNEIPSFDLKDNVII